jgi:hypothetical protein
MRLMMMAVIEDNPWFGSWKYLSDDTLSCIAITLRYNMISLCKIRICFSAGSCANSPLQFCYNGLHPKSRVTPNRTSLAAELKLRRRRVN